MCAYAPYNQDRYPTKAEFQHLFNDPPIFKLKSYGEGIFTVSVPTEWNKLPLKIKTAFSIDYFKNKVKHIFT